MNCDHAKKRFIGTNQSETYTVDLEGNWKLFLRWSNACEQITLCQPYLIAVIGSHIEIRHTLNVGVGERINLDGVKVKMPWATSSVPLSSDRVFLIFESNESESLFSLT